MTPEILTAVIVAVLSSKLWDFLAARFKRKDEREDKQDKVLQAIKDLTVRVDGIGTRVDENAAVLARTHILRFNDELINNIEHSQSISANSYKTLIPTKPTVTTSSIPQPTQRWQSITSKQLTKGC